MTDNYENMAANPLHLRLMMEGQGDSDMQAHMLDEGQPPKATSDPIIPLGQQASELTDSGPHPDPEASARRARSCDKSHKATDIKQCWNSLKFSIVGGKLSSNAQKFSKEASDCVYGIIDFLSARLDEINQTTKSTPIRTKQQEADNHQDIIFLKTLSKTLDGIPVELKIHIPEFKPIRDQILDCLQEDLLAVQSLCFSRINTMKKHAYLYRKAIDLLKCGKKTRQNEMIIIWEKALPDHLLQTSLDQDLNEDWQSTQESISEEMQRPSTLELGQKDANVTFVKSPVPISDLKDAGKSREDSTQNEEMRNLWVRDLSPKKCYQTVNGNQSSV